MRLFPDTDLTDDGYAREMCPERERKKRVSMGMVHAMERVRGEDGSSGSALIKQYVRSAAGKDLAQKDLVRSSALCLRTAKYIINRVFDGGLDSLDSSRFDFAWDRLRSVRQDLAVTDARDANTAGVLEISVRFHLLAGYALCELSAADFDPHLNFTHVSECLKELLVLYSELGVCADRMKQMAAAYLMLNLGSSESLQWILEQSHELRSAPDVVAAVRANFCYLEGNFVGLCRAVRRLSIIPLLAFHWNWPRVARHQLLVMRAAYNSKACRYPLPHLSHLLLLGEELAVKLCAQLSIDVDVGQGVVHFIKKDVQMPDKVTAFRSDIIDERLSCMSKSMLLEY